MKGGGKYQLLWSINQIVVSWISLEQNEFLSLEVTLIPSRKTTMLQGYCNSRWYFWQEKQSCHLCKKNPKHFFFSLLSPQMLFSPKTISQLTCSSKYSEFSAQPIQNNWNSVLVMPCPRTGFRGNICNTVAYTAVFWSPVPEELTVLIT